MLTKAPLKKEQVASDIKAYIKTNRMPAGSRLLSEKKLASHFGVNHLTIRSALGILEEVGVVTRRPGSGTYVNDGGEGADRGSELVAMVLYSKGHMHEDLVERIQRRLYERNMISVVFPTDIPDFGDRILDDLNQLREKGCGRVIINQAAFKEELFHKIIDHPNLRDARFVRILGNKPDVADFPGRRVTVDYPESFRLIVEHLQSLGHERIALVVGGLRYDEFGQSNKKTVELFTRAMVDAGLVEKMKICVYARPKEDEARLIEMLEAVDRPTAFVGDIDWRGTRVLKFAKALGVSVPEQISVVGHYNTPWSQMTNMTTIGYDLDYFAKMIVQVLEDGEESKDPVLIQPELIVRETTGPISI